MFKNFTYRIFLLVLMLSSAGVTPVSSAYDDEEDYIEEEPQGYSLGHQGDTEVYDQEDGGEAYSETSAPVETQYNEAQEDYTEELHVEQEAQANDHLPVWEGPIPFEPAYSGKENIRIERSTRLKRKPDIAETAKRQGREDKEAKQKQAAVSQGECNPVVRIRANQESPFDILKALADEHGFEIMMLEAENNPISLEKHEVLSRVIESITRDMSVVLNYQKEGACERLVAISVLDNSEWSGVGNTRMGTPGNSSTNANVRQYKPKLSSFSSSRDKSMNFYNSPSALEQGQADKQELQELREKRRKARVQRTQGDDSSEGEYLNRGSYKKGTRKSQAEQIDNMEVYVDEVMSGKRVPNIRELTIKQRTEYMRLRRQYKNQD